MTRKDGKSRMDMLDWKAENWQTPRVTDAQGSAYQYDRGNHDKPRETLSGQSQSFPQGPTNLSNGQKPSVQRRSLNPLFVEWLMGWPPNWTQINREWTDCGLSAMELSRWLQLMRGALSKLATCDQAEQIANEKQLNLWEIQL